MSTKAERTAGIDKLEKAFTHARGIYVADNNKITVAQVTKLRSNLRKKGMRFLVVKNTLAKIAAKKSGREAITSYFKGPTAVVIAPVDAAAPAKLIRDFQKENKDKKDLLAVKVAYVDGSIFNAAQVLMLADIPNREVLLAQFLGCLKAPMGNLARVLSGILVKFARTLDALKDKKGTA
jgi:large subunit ribosomal protein L10